MKKHKNSGWLYIQCWCFPGFSECKESAFNGGDLGLILGLGRSPGEGGNVNWYNHYREQYGGSLKN